MGLPFRYHWLPDAALDVSVTELPLQKVVGPPGVIVGVEGIGLTVIVPVAVKPTQPPPVNVIV